MGRRFRITKSIIQDKAECYVCHYTFGLQRHHVYEGIGRRNTSEKYGCWVWLCSRHHTGDFGIHNYKPENKKLDLFLKQECQRILEQKMDREEFRRLFGRSYL
jgi:hypothetical protein